MTQPQGGLTCRVRAYDARRAGLLVIAGAIPEAAPLSQLCDDFAEQGYDVLAPPLGVDMEEAIAAVAPPVCILGIGEGAALAWELACRHPDLTAASLFDPPLSGLQTNAPLCPAIVEIGLLGSTITPAEIEAFRWRHEAIPLHPYPVAPAFIWRNGDAGRLARLRTLQLFHRSCVSRGEMGG